MKDIKYGIVFKKPSDEIILVELDGEYKITRSDNINDFESVYDSLDHDRLSLVTIEEEGNSCALTDLVTFQLATNGGEDFALAEDFFSDITNPEFNIEDQKSIVKNFFEQFQSTIVN